MNVPLLVAAIGLGIAGFDPFGALLVAGALTIGASWRAALSFTLASAVVPIPLALLAGHALGPAITAIEEHLSLPASIWVVITLGAGVAMIGWAVRRIRRPPGEPKERPPLDVSARAMALAGLAFGVTVLADPAYYAIIAVVARNPDPAARAAAVVVWFLISECLLIALVVASFTGAHRRAAEGLRRAWRRASPVINGFITIALLVVGVLLILDGTWFLITGHFMVG